ncbi:MAG: hypothetical protein B5M53_03710 [Candidatus Cloacimonas sp. 4484_209]|nr:MAG: hypothetical protein B5M53_03710 [Candidatus Cloacimonas sp. 4484_209]
MLFSAVDHEQKLRDEFLKYPAEDYKDPEKDAYTDKFMLVCGMYFAASISYYYMALEGFVNLIYHAFLRDEFSDRELNLEQRLDLEQKIRLMPRLCCGFKNRHIDRKSDIFKNFKRLKNYRNKIFHSKIEDALKRMTFYENSFFYTCDMEKNQEHRFPSRKINLKIEDVLTVKSIVDKIVKEILSIMKEESRILTDQFIMKTVNVPFWKKETGKIALGNP